MRAAVTAVTGTLSTLTPIHCTFHLFISSRYSCHYPLFQLPHPTFHFRIFHPTPSSQRNQKNSSAAPLVQIYKLPNGYHLDYYPYNVVQLRSKRRGTCHIPPLHRWKSHFPALSDWDPQTFYAGRSMGDNMQESSVCETRNGNDHCAQDSVVLAKMKGYPYWPAQVHVWRKQWSVAEGK